MSKPDNQAPGAATRAERATREAAAAALVDELKKLVCEALTTRLDRMFDGADDLLFEMAGRGRNNDEQRVYFDTMRVVRLNRPVISRTFAEKVDAGFAPDAVVEKRTESSEISFDELSLQESRSVEETIAISNMISKAEGLHQRQLWELGRRLEWLIQECRAPISRDALSPAMFCNAFRTGADSLKVDFAIELVIYKLFDRQVLGDLADLYAAIAKLFDRHGVKAAALSSGVRSSAAGRTGAAPGADAPAGLEALLAGGAARGGPPPAEMPGGTYAMGSPGPGGFMPADAGFAEHGAPGAEAMPVQFAPAAYLPQMSMPMGTAVSSYGVPMPSLDAFTIGALQGAGARAGGAPGVYGDAQLAADLSNAAQGEMIAGWDVLQAYAYLQRTGLVGRMFNDILADPNVPGHLKPQFDRLRFSVIKSALKDSSFFANPKHPVRGLVNELATMAASARTTGPETITRIQDLVAKIQGQFDEAAAGVRQPDEPAPLMREPEVESFLDQQLLQSKARRQLIIDKARRVVAEELQLRMVGQSIPASAQALLLSGWAPMMALRLLRHGMDSESWRGGISTFRRIVHALDPRMKVARTPLERDELFADIEDDLSEVGMPAKRIKELLQGLREALEAIDAVRAPAPAQLPPSPVPEDADLGPAAQALLARLGQAASLPPAEPPAPTAAAPAVAPAMPDSPAALLRLLTVPGSWFRVYDRERHESRWLKVVERYDDDERPAYRDSVAFAEFNGRNTLLIKSQLLLEDMLAGRAEPFDQSPMAKSALQAFMANKPE